METPASKESYFPLTLIFAYLVGGVALIGAQTGDFSRANLMRHFMGGFFVVFSFFKMLDLKGFASGFATYDIAAKRIRAYGFVYPFVELALGLAYLASFRPALTNAVTAGVMLVSTIGVVHSIVNRRKLRCACLGTMFNLPMSTVTLIEDMLMLGMALAMMR